MATNSDDAIFLTCKWTLAIAIMPCFDKIIIVEHAIIIGWRIKCFVDSHFLTKDCKDRCSPVDFGRSSRVRAVSGAPAQEYRRRAPLSYAMVAAILSDNLPHKGITRT